MTLPPDQRWRQVQRLCEAVDGLAPAEQAAQLRALEPDEDVRRDARALLEARAGEDVQQRAHQHLETAAVAAARLPDEIGGVRIQAFVGSGGSGDVYRGVRTTNGTEQAVAVKWYYPHRASPGDLERFTSEQRMLATLTHPAIVRFLDAGVTPDRRPFLVMELAEGQPITEYSDGRALPLTDRLRLFLDVCDAVASVHRRLIVHLDLKPSNIIVTHEGYVKLLDFGTAKLADPSIGLTRTEPLTVQYASPERLRGEPVAVSCDVYSLGLVLCELVVGRPPFLPSASLVAIADRATGHVSALPLARLVSHDAAVRRGTTIDALRRALRGLDAIVAKSTAWDPAARYPSVAELAADIRRYVGGEPVLARIPRAAAAREAIRKYAWLGLGLLVLAVAAASLSWRGVPQAPGVVDAEPRGLAAANPARPAEAGNGPFDARTSMRTPATEAIGVRMFDDFVSPRAATIRAVTWQGIYCREVPNGGPPPATAVAFRVAFHADANGSPDPARVFQEAVYPVARTTQVLDRTFMARCGSANTTYAAYSYGVTLDRPFRAMPGVRHWFTVQAHVADNPAGRPLTYWGWVSGAPFNGRSVQLGEDGRVNVFRLDRSYGLIE